MESKIKVIDSFTGSGKTTWAINYINRLSDDTRIIYITPFLKECDRIVESCRQRNFVQPDRHIKGAKMNHLIELITKGENIVSTHALFSNIDDTLIKTLRVNNYILFLDETMNVVENFDLYADTLMDDDTKTGVVRKDMQSLERKHYIKVNKEDFSVDWISNDNLGKYNMLKELADRNLLYFINDALLIWTFPVEVFNSDLFSEIYLLTYLFDYQIQSLYYSYFNIEYEYFHIETINGEYTLVPTKNNSNEKKWKKTVKPLITIVDSKNLNKIGGMYRDQDGKHVTTALSKTWYENNPELLDKLGKNIANFFGNYTKSKSSQRMWTCFKNYIPQIKNKYFSKNYWLEVTARARNDYGTRDTLAYCVNRYPNPLYQHFFKKRNVSINEDQFALSEMQQWVWRSAIRNLQPITLYIPSERMRMLFINWLNDEDVVYDEWKVKRYYSK